MTITMTYDMHIFTMGFALGCITGLTIGVALMHYLIKRQLDRAFDHLQAILGTDA